MTTAHVTGAHGDNMMVHVAIACDNRHQKRHNIRLANTMRYHVLNEDQAFLSDPALLARRRSYQTGSTWEVRTSDRVSIHTRKPILIHSASPTNASAPPAQAATAHAKATVLIAASGVDA